MLSPYSIKLCQCLFLSKHFLVRNQRNPLIHRAEYLCGPTFSTLVFSVATTTKPLQLSWAQPKDYIKRIRCRNYL